MRRLRLFHLLLLLSIAAILVCLWGFARALFQQRQGKAYYQALAVTNRPPVMPSADPESADSEENILVDIGEIPVPAGSAPPADDPCELESESSEAEWTPYLDFETMRETAPGLAAWIRCENTPINYPVVLGSDNVYYLQHLPDGRKHIMGSIFLDYRMTIDFESQNTLIYGHNTKNGDMFGSLDRYGKQAYYEEHPVMMLYTPERDYTVELFAGYIIDSTQELLPLSFESEADFEQYVYDIQRRSVFKSAVEVTTEDCLVFLCTCAYDFPYARFILAGRLTWDERLPPSCVSQSDQAPSLSKPHP